MCNLYCNVAHFLQLHSRRTGPRSHGIFVVFTIHPSSDHCSDPTDATVGANAACYSHVLPQYASETDRCSVCSNRLVSRVQSVVFAIHHKANCLDTGTSWSRINSLPERLQLGPPFVRVPLYPGVMPSLTVQLCGCPFTLM